jgi:hypothetical protein
LTPSIASTTAPAELPDITRGSRFCIKSVLTTPKWYMPDNGGKKLVISLLILLLLLKPKWYVPKGAVLLAKL